MGAVNGLADSPAGQALGAAISPVAAGNLGAISNVPSLVAKMPGTFGPALGGMFGTAGGQMGTGIAGPEGAPIQQAVNPAQAQQVYGQTQDALAQQQALLNALNMQNGMGNQSSVFNQSQDLANALSQANGIGKQNQVYGSLQGIAGQQQGLANQYQQIANGQGPNPAQNMLNQATGQNVANQAALMAGQRGAGANVGLMARQAAMQGAGIQQNAAGQAATMQSQQQLGALQGLGAQQQAMAGTQTAAGQLAGTQLGAQQAQQGAMANQAAQQVQQQMGATTTLNQAQQAQQQAILGAMANQNQAAVSNQNSINAANAGVTQTAMQGQQGMIGGIMQGGAAAMGAAKAHGGMITPMANGGTVAPPDPAAPASAFGQFLQGWGGGMNTAPMAAPEAAAPVSGSRSLSKGSSDMTAALASRMRGPGAPAGPNDMPNAPQPIIGAAMQAYGGLSARGGGVAAKNTAQQASKKGDSYSNDKIPTVLSEGEIVLPRSVTMSKDPARSAADFVRKVIAKRRAS